MNKYILNHSEEYYRELALVKAFIVNEDIMEGTVYQTFDEIYDKVAPAFIEKYPLNTNWEEFELDFDELVIEFTKDYIIKNRFI